MRYSPDLFYKSIELAKQKSFEMNEHLDEYSGSDLTDVLEMNIMLYELIKIKEGRN